MSLYIFSGEHLLCARLGPSNRDASDGCLEEVQRIMRQIRQTWPEVKITLRGDSVFCREELMTWCEQNQVDYVLGLAKNERLKAETTRELEQARQQWAETGKTARVFKEFVRKSDAGELVTGAAGDRQSRASGEGSESALCGDLARPRAAGKPVACMKASTARDVRWRIASKSRLMLFADRTSTPFLRSNQIRLYFSSFACTLMAPLRRLGLKGTDLAKAQASTTRLKLVKIGALVRKVLVSLAGGYPFVALFARVYAELRGSSAPW